ncbi:uncharacterized protein [Typha latifolia]|uniref:uncharacterized protein n=1 Tax=Typha latifolia TaxID=4733 RepID=UPI003C2CC179
MLCEEMAFMDADQVKEMKLNAPSNSNSIEKLAPVVINLNVKDRSTNVISQATPPTISREISTPRREGKILKALKESGIFAPKRVLQERLNKKLFLRIPGLATAITKTKLTRIRKLFSATIASMKHTKDSASTTSSGGVSPSVTRTRNEANGSDAEEDSPLDGAAGISTPPKKIILTCKMKVSASEYEKRRITRKWDYVKVIIGDIQEALRENPTSIETAEIIENGVEELQQLGQDIEASVEEIVPMLEKLAAEIKYHSYLDIQIVKREISSKLSTELTSLTDPYVQYAEAAEHWRNTMDMQENMLERVEKRRGSYDTKIWCQRNKIAKIKKELASAKEELEGMKKEMNDLLEEEERKKEIKPVLLELNLNAIKEEVNQINDYVDHLNETVDREFEIRKKEKLDLVE